MTKEVVIDMFSSSFTDEIYCEFFTCPNCGDTRIIEDDSFCRTCGSAIRFDFKIKPKYLEYFKDSVRLLYCDAIKSELIHDSLLYDVKGSSMTSITKEDFHHIIRRANLSKYASFKHNDLIAVDMAKERLTDDEFRRLVKGALKNV